MDRAPPIRGAVYVAPRRGFPYRLLLLGLVPLALPGAFNTRAMVVDVETRGELTRGMTVVDTRLNRTGTPNVEMAVGVDVEAVRAYMNRILAQAP